MSRLTTVATRTLAATLAVAALAACGSDDDGAASTSPGAGSPTTLAPEDVIVPDAQVTEGLGDTVDLMTSLVADPAAAAKDDRVDTLWFSYEGTVKSNEVALYLDFEDALASFREAAKQGDAGGMDDAIASFSAARDSYLAKHPG